MLESMVLEKLFHDDQPNGGGDAGICLAVEATVGRRFGPGACASAPMDTSAITTVLTKVLIGYPVY
jgi:hypothetical protein